MWKTINFKVLLKLRCERVTDMFLVSMILHNAKCCLNGNQTAAYFVLQSPTLETWLSQGPRPLSAEATARLNMGPNPEQANLPDMIIQPGDIHPNDQLEYDQF